MAYMMIEDFSGGMDLRKSALTAKPGTLRTLTNGFVGPGGEIEKRKALTSLGSVPGTHGVAFCNNALVVFGTDALAPTLPSHVAYQRLDTGKTIRRVLDAHVFGTGIYTVAQMTDGTVEHFFGSGKVTVTGTNVRPHRTKMYAVDGQNLRFSAVKNATDWSGTGAGVIDLTTEDAGAADLVGLETYYGMLALFGRTSVQVWELNPDPLLNTQQQVLGGIGLVAPNAVARYGSGDVLFLSHTGIRSLRARDSSNAAVLNDIGSPVDAYVAALRAVLNTGTVERLSAFVDPLTGHFWLTWDFNVVVLAYYPNSKITAWSVLGFPVRIDYATVAGSRIVVRSGDDLFIYGTLPTSGSPFDPNAPTGQDPAEYDAASVTIVTPMIDVQQPATEKHWQGLDVACEGAWDVFVNPAYDQPDVWTKIASIEGSTFNAGRLPIDMRSTHLQVKLVSTGTGPRKLAALGLHFSGGEAS